MPDYDTRDVPAPASASLDNLVLLTHVMYALHAFAVVTGILGSATIIVSFVASLPSIAAVILNYLKRPAVRGTWLDSHFRWQLRTFWFGVLWIAVSVLLAVTIIGIPVAFAVIVVAGLWILYRIARGWWNLAQRDVMPLPAPPV